MQSLDYCCVIAKCNLERGWQRESKEGEVSSFHPPFRAFPKLHLDVEAVEIIAKGYEGNRKSHCVVLGGGDLHGQG